ncbi:MAG: [NiFe]-hydrogenase assembly chaperone HybE [Proteobacteria bacterium]|nr:[NiFe]-hydrogenase assembly chaperone HybE [Pseudomonadota bacterium]
MNDPQAVSECLEEVFTRIHQQQMQGIPILNPAIRIQALGFQIFQGRVLGVLITPWLMNVVMLAREDEDWSELKLGQKQPHNFPSGVKKFMLNEIDGIGVCQTHSLYSPMREFSSHEHALRIAQQFLDTLMVERTPGEEELVDEELLGRIMRGEVRPETDFEDFAAIDAGEPAADADEVEIRAKPVDRMVSRRNLLRGKLHNTA